MEDSCEQIRIMCKLWWNTRNLKKDQELFQKNGKYHIKGSHNATRCWVWQIDKFLNTEFEYNTINNKKVTFKPKDLNDEIKNRLISQLGIEIGLFNRDLLYFYNKYPIT